MHPADKRFLLTIGAAIAVVVLIAVLGATEKLGYPR
jgi:hypothetical protein